MRLIFSGYLKRVCSLFMYPMASDRMPEPSGKRLVHFIGLESLFFLPLMMK